MVTEGLPSPCSLCFDEPLPRPPHSAHSVSHQPSRSTAYSSAPQSSVGHDTRPRDLHAARPSTSHASDLDGPPQRATLRRAATAAAAAASTSLHSSPLDTPPESPRLLHQQYQHPRRDSSFRQTYDETVTRKQGPCVNCAMTLPRRQSSLTGAGRDLAFDDAQGPTLRTRAPIERVLGPSGQASPPNSQSSSDTDCDTEATGTARQRQRPLASNPRTASWSSTLTAPHASPHHLHYVSYTSTREPVLPDSFSLVRASCLRALSFETLPRMPSTSAPTLSPRSRCSSPFVTTQSPGSAATGGAIFFGDATAGYTTAYIFRLPDLHARGHKRVYAFLALSTYRERLAMKTFAVISAAFRDMARWIQRLAEAEASRTRESSPLGNVLRGGLPAYLSSPSPFDGPSETGQAGSGSFLTGGYAFNRRMAGPSGTSNLRARGLAELVGQPDFFIDLHTKFVRLLLEAGVTLNS